jgi:hypothetical protein
VPQAIAVLLQFSPDWTFEVIDEGNLLNFQNPISALDAKLYSDCCGSDRKKLIAYS